MFLTPIVHLLIVIFVTQGALCCENNWIGHGSSCYHFSHDTETWVDAMAVCKLLGGYLVEINDQSENNFVINNFQYTYAWIGLTDLIEEGVWEWMTSKTLLQTSEFWNPGEPSNDGGDGNCAHVYNKASSYHGWNDKPCSTVSHYVCEKSNDEEVVVG